MDTIFRGENVENLRKTEFSFKSSVLCCNIKECSKLSRQSFPCDKNLMGNMQLAMASSIGFSGPASVQHTRHALNIHLLWKKHNHVETKRLQRQLCTRSKALKKPREDLRLNMVVMSVSNSRISINPPPSDTIKQFYECINEKNLNKLAKFISRDCFFEELSFFKPFQGRKVPPVCLYLCITACPFTHVYIYVCACLRSLL
ncbi:hypothetical protein LguiA_015694 [Lonicera macranthoides]